MKHLLSVLGLVFCSFSLLAQGEQEEAKIRQVLQSQQEAWNQGDLKAFMQGYWNSKELRFIGSSGINYGWKKTLKNYQRSYPTQEKMGQLTFEILSVELLSEESAFVIGKWQLQRTEDLPKGHFTLLWKKIEGEWKIVADHSS